MLDKIIVWVAERAGWLTWVDRQHVERFLSSDEVRSASTPRFRELFRQLFFACLAGPGPKIHYTEVSATAAKEHLKIALRYNRNRLEQEAIESLREELVRLMAEHFDIETEDLEVNIDDNTGTNRLVASITFWHRSRRSQNKTSPQQAQTSP